MDQMQAHAWITNQGTQPCDWKNDVEYVTFDDVTEEEVSNAMTKVDKVKNIVFIRKNK